MAEEMVITPEDQALNDRIKVLPVLKEVHADLSELKEDNDVIMNKLGNLEVGQTETQERLDEGAEQFKLLWSEVKIMKNSIDKLGDIFNNGIEKLSQEIFNSKLDAALSNNAKVSEENKELKRKLEKKDSKDWDVKKIVIGSVMSLIIIALVVALGLKG